VSTYAEFLRAKQPSVQSSGFAVSAGDINPKLFPFQRDIVKWALRRGKAGIFSECGTGKTAMQLEWARHVAERAGPVLILAPLAVAHQTVAEGEKFGIPVTQALERCDVPCDRKAIVVTNYDRLKKFEPADFTGIVLDESSILKCYTGAMKRLIMESFRTAPYKLACTATPAPNDHMELGNHSEFLDAMESNEMLSRWFLNDTMKAGGYRLKRHAERDFWRWVASWSVSVSKPSDLGYPDGKFILPKLNIIQHTVYVDPTIGSDDGMLIRKSDLSATTLHKEMRLTAPQRAERVAALVNGDIDPWIIWCNTDYEADELAARIPEAVEVRGSHPLKRKEADLWRFAAGECRVLLTKPSIAGFGLNFQHCHNMAFVGLSYSYEQQYQAIRRSYRFGQEYPVNVHIIAADTEGKVADTVLRKQREHERMKAAMVESMRELQLAEVRPLSLTNGQMPKIEVPEWINAR
jgi:hypothetical protein